MNPIHQQQNEVVNSWLCQAKLRRNPTVYGPQENYQQGHQTETHQRYYTHTVPQPNALSQEFLLMHSFGAQGRIGQVAFAVALEV